jgi:glycosyltransferase involved in cell wall biosynthesis
MTDPLGQSQVIPYLKGLSKLGYRFTLLSVEKKDRYDRHSSIIKSQLSNCEIDWQVLIYTKSPRFLSKIYDQFKLIQKSIQLHRNRKFDVVHCRSYVAAAAGYKLNKKYGIPFLFDMRGFWVDERVENGQWNLNNPGYKILYKFYKKLERLYLMSASKIISLTESGKNELIKNYNVHPNNITVIPCCVDLDHFNYQNIKFDEQLSLKRNLNINKNDKILSYLGSLGGWYLATDMIKFFGVLNKVIPNTIFLLITFDNANQVEQVALDCGIDLSTIRIISAQRSEVPLLLSISDWSIFFINSTYSKIGSSPTKQAEAMAMGLPLICNDIGDTGNIVKDSKSGYVLDSLSEAEYQKVSNRMVTDLHAKASIRAAAVQHYNIKDGISSYSLVYDMIAK